MKKINFLKGSVIMFLCITTLLFTSCSKDDDPMYSIVGKWSFVDSELEIYINDIDFVTYMEDELGVPSNLSEDYYEDMKSEFDIDISGDIEFKENGTCIETSPYSDESIVGKWSVNSDNTKLSITSDGETGNFDIIKLTETELHIAIYESQKQDLNEDGVTDTITVEIVFSLEK